ncbi:transcriptional adapter, putative [Pediculus humanus corporis]|uniref:Transcriptional adapter n=1 Tax=Pediculus humanus subsp. corporis TaxID=121224 RepID=E0VNF5_PEDHC|nr:transcriptional adapter, putative [Pediculus humanus corporis]EEB14911.1 transcriptional adapter, putative [Pediculus humanus corporis]
MADLFAKFNCTYCQEDINGLRVKCVDCSEFELCLQCFSAGAEIGPHKNDHAYQLVNSEAVGLTFGKSQWTAREELHLLDAIELYGFGNWEDISKHIETRSSEEAKDEYINRYLDGNIGRLTWPTAANLRPNLSDTSNYDKGPLSPSLSSRLLPLDVTPERAAQLGYMPLRDDFEREYDNDAESLVSSLFISETEDEDLDVALKLVHVDMYIHRLRERARRKRVGRDYQLVSNFFNSGSKKDKCFNKKKLTKEEKEFHDGMRAFCQFHTAQEHEQFLQNMQREQELKIRLTELFRYRRNGLTRHEECAHFEQELYYQQELYKEKQNSLDSSGLNQIDQPQITTLLRSKEKSEEHALYSIARKSILKNLGSQFRINGNANNDGNPSEEVNNTSQVLLTVSEIQLCNLLDVSPSEYLTLKGVLIKDSSETGDYTPLENQVKIFLESKGWLYGNLPTDVISS